MRTVAITINKGGVGKTTLTKSIATAATAAGFNVLVLDMDIAPGSRRWKRWGRHASDAGGMTGSSI
jgi:chromosome partitioning protein